jgi:uncharacterized protein YggE
LRERCETGGSAGWVDGMPEVVTRGTGEHEVVADRAEIQVTFSAEAADRSTAVSRLARRMAAVEPALAPDAVEERQRSVSVQTLWDNNRRAGCTAQELLVLRVSDLAVLDDLLAALFTAEPDWLNGPQWSLADEGAAMREAQLKAVEDARTRAQAYADALGGQLGALIRLADDGVERPYPMAVPMAMAAEGSRMGQDSVRQLGLTPGLVTVRAVCTAVWSLDR